MASAGRTKLSVRYASASGCRRGDACPNDHEGGLCIQFVDGQSKPRGPYPRRRTHTSPTRSCATAVEAHTHTQQAKGRDTHIYVDVSTSMRTDGRLEQVKASLKDLVDSLDAGERFSLYTFARTVERVLPMGEKRAHGDVGKVIESLAVADDGRALYGAICHGVAAAKVVNPGKEAADAAALRVNRSQRIIVVTDGLDTAACPACTAIDASSALSRKAVTLVAVLLGEASRGGDVHELQKAKKKTSNNVKIIPAEHSNDIARALQDVRSRIFGAGHCTSSTEAEHEDDADGSVASAPSNPAGDVVYPLNEIGNDSPCASASEAVSLHRGANDHAQCLHEQPDYCDWDADVRTSVRTTVKPAPPGTSKDFATVGSRAICGAIATCQCRGSSNSVQWSSRPAAGRVVGSSETACASPCPAAPEEDNCVSEAREPMRIVERPDCDAKAGALMERHRITMSAEAKGIAGVPQSLQASGHCLGRFDSEPAESVHAANARAAAVLPDAGCDATTPQSGVASPCPLAPETDFSSPAHPESSAGAAATA